MIIILPQSVISYCFFFYFRLSNVHFLCKLKKRAAIYYKNVILVFSVPESKFHFLMHELIFDFITPNGNTAFQIRILSRIQCILIRKVATYQPISPVVLEHSGRSRFQLMLQARDLKFLEYSFFAKNVAKSPNLAKLSRAK